MYTIDQVAKKLEIPKSTIRYYEKKGLITPERSQGNYRIFTETDCLCLQYIYVMRWASFSLEEIRGVLLLLNTPYSPTCFTQGRDFFQSKQKEINEKIHFLKQVSQLLLTYETLAKKPQTEKEYKKVREEGDGFMKALFETQVKKSGNLEEISENTNSMVDVFD